MLEYTDGLITLEAAPGEKASLVQNNTDGGLRVVAFTGSDIDGSDGFSVVYVHARERTVRPGGACRIEGERIAITALVGHTTVSLFGTAADIRATLSSLIESVDALTADEALLSV